LAGDSANRDALPARERDLLDLQEEVSGQENGRQKRFFPEGWQFTLKEEEKKKREEAYENMLQYLLRNDPLYAALYLRVSSSLKEEELATEKALQDIERRQALSSEKLELLEGNASTLDGKKVFRSRDGQSVFTEDEEIVNAQDQSRINWRKDATIWENYRDTKLAHEKIIREREAIQNYQRDVLIPSRERLSDKDTPALHEELESLEKRFKDERPQAVERYITPHNTGTEKHTKIYSADDQIKAPDINRQFSQARLDIPDLGNMNLPPNPETPAVTSIPKLGG
jgi:hypothetical protein